MIVKEALEEIKILDNTIVNLERLLLLPSDEKEEIAERLQINQPLDHMLMHSINSCKFRRGYFQHKIDNAVLPD